MIKTITYVLSIHCILISIGYSQNESDSVVTNRCFYFAGINFGRTNIQDIYSRENIINYGIALSKQKWPYLIKLLWQRNAEFTLGVSGPKSSIGFISSISEYNILYNYLIHMPFSKKLYTGIGTGIGAIYITRNIDYTSESEETAKKDSFMRLGIPFEFRLGFLYPSKKIQVLDFIYFFNWNSVDNFRGWKLNFNIGLN